MSQIYQIGKKDGKHIVVFPPSWWLCNNLGMRAEDVLQNTIDELKKHTDREIRVRVKKIKGQYNPVPLHEDLKDAHAVVSFQSSAAAKAIIKGIPSFTITDKYSAAIPMSLTDLSKIETPIYPENRYELNSLKKIVWKNFIPITFSTIKIEILKIINGHLSKSNLKLFIFVLNFFTF